MLTITRGDDRHIGLFVVKSNNRPYDLTGWTQISVFFKKADGTLLEKTTKVYSTPAYAEYSDITYTADNAGSIGNGITITFDGMRSLQVILDEYNLANPTNTVSFSEPVKPASLTIPPAGSISLSGGIDNIRDVTVASDVLGHIVCSLRDSDTVQLMLGKVLTFKVVIDKGEPPLGERRNVLFHNQLEIVDSKF